MDSSVVYTYSEKLGNQQVVTNCLHHSFLFVPQSPALAVSLLPPKYHSQMTNFSNCDFTQVLPFRAECRNENKICILLAQCQEETGDIY